ncbi:cysteine-rich receptor-like protein kinase 44 isoform X2 [Rutidosis leptorrhynchoides]|uniref:cysteine-rich receptor-like protein kinase 44 isoform X2 n=1 Tax=Rutidosis leptorrhynchoides TaxID=125765 RepID=UPI003A9A63D6
MAQVMVALKCILALQEKEDVKLQARGMTIFGKKMSTLVFPSNRKNSVGVENLKPLELYLSNLQDENQLLRRFHFDIIEVATEKFSEFNRISDGGYYGCLYKGRLQNGQDITVLSPYCDFMKDKELVINEVSVLVKLKYSV